MTALASFPIALAAALALLLAAPAAAAGFTDVLAAPAQISPLASHSLMQAVTRAGNRLVAVGQRGQIVVSTDGGATWKQAQVPVSSDLTAVYFADERNGWATGHDGVVLHSADGGDTWQLQLDGRKANALLVEALAQKVAAEPAAEAMKRLLTEAKRYQAEGPDKPFLDVWFADENNGYVVGAYNLIFRTRDGGKTWESWFDRTANPKFFNLYAIRPAAGGLFIAGEGGLVLRLDAAGQRFDALPTPYNGSFFGVADAQGAVLVFGLRGTVLRSDDGGRNWTQVAAGLPATIVAAAQSAQHATLLADMGGRVAVTEDGGRTFHALALKQPMPLTGLAGAGEGRLALSGPRGVVVTQIAAR
jgi:photosystem II stability/assembly factor-like uncharacterized protein